MQQFDDVSIAATQTDPWLYRVDTRLRFRAAAAVWMFLMEVWADGSFHEVTMPDSKLSL